MRAQKCEENIITLAKNSRVFAMTWVQPNHAVIQGVTTEFMKKKIKKKNRIIFET